MIFNSSQNTWKTLANADKSDVQDDVHRNRVPIRNYHIHHGVRHIVDLQDLPSQKNGPVLRADHERVNSGSLLDLVHCDNRDTPTFATWKTKNPYEGICITEAERFHSKMRILAQSVTVKEWGYVKTPDLSGQSSLLERSSLEPRPPLERSPRNLSRRFRSYSSSESPILQLKDARKPKLAVTRRTLANNAASFDVYPRHTIHTSLSIFGNWWNFEYVQLVRNKRVKIKENILVLKKITILYTHVNCIVMI